MTDEGNAPPLAAILRATPEALTYLLQLPAGAYIDSVYAPHDAHGVLEFRIRGAGWPIVAGAIINRATAIVRQDYSEDGTVMRRCIDWGLPNTDELSDGQQFWACPTCRAIMHARHKPVGSEADQIVAGLNACLARHG